MSNNPQQTHLLGNITHVVTISLAEAATGKTESLIVPREDACEICSGTGQSWRSEGACANCNNTGYLRHEKRFEVRIPAGIESGSKMRIAGEGSLGAAQAARGDLFIVVNVSPHELFERKGKDLHSFFRVTEDEIKVGGEVIVPTLLDGQKRLRIPPGTNAGTVFRLAGLGLCSLADAGRGDLFVSVGNEPVKHDGANAGGASVVTPPSTRQRGAVKEFVSNHSKGLVFAALLLCASLIYFNSQRSNRSVLSTSDNANISSPPAAKLAPPRVVIPDDPPPPPPPSFTQPTSTPFSLPNGANITPPQGPRGDMTMKIVNSGYTDIALKVVSSSSQKTRRFVFIRSGSTAVIRNLPHEVCLLRWETGSDWDVNSRRFLYARSLHQFDQTFDLRKARYTVDFTPSPEGTLHEEALDESEFEDK